MKHIKTGLNRGQFDLLVATRGAQAAKMTLRPGATSDDKRNSLWHRYLRRVWWVSGESIARLAVAIGQQLLIALSTELRGGELAPES